MVVALGTINAATGIMTVETVLMSDTARLSHHFLQRLLRTDVMNFCVVTDAVFRNLCFATDTTTAETTRTNCIVAPKLLLQQVLRTRPPVLSLTFVVATASAYGRAGVAMGTTTAVTIPTKRIAFSPLRQRRGKRRRLRGRLVTSFVV